MSGHSTRSCSGNSLQSVRLCDLKEAFSDSVTLDEVSIDSVHSAWRPCRQSTQSMYNPHTILINNINEGIHCKKKITGLNLCMIINLFNDE